MKMFRVRRGTSAVAITAVAAILVWGGLSAHGRGGGAGAPGAGGVSSADAPSSAEVPRPPAQEDDHAELAGRLRTLSERAGGQVGVAVIHIETGRAVEVEGATPLPLYSVFKLPLAVAVLRDVEENRLRLDRRVSVTPEEAAAGSKGNTDLWRKPVGRTVAELLELSLVRSDNTSSDVLLRLVGGPAAVTQRMRALGLQDIEVRSSVREMAAGKFVPSTGTASDLARLLVRLQQGQVLRPPQLALLLDYMGRATTGLRRLRGDLPAGTPVADKTGTGAAGAATNDVGLITLPEGKGRLAMAVLVSGSKLPTEAQEKLIAELARAAYDAHVSPTARGN